MKNKQTIVIILLTLALVLTASIACAAQLDAKNVYSMMVNAPPYLFIAIYSLFPSLFLPIIPLAILSGFLYGPVVGTIYATFSCTLGGSFAFLLSRYYLKDWVLQKTPGRVALIQGYIKKNAWQFIAISRVTPIFPFNIQNYLFGVTDVRLRTFVLSTLFSVIPGLFLYVYMGYLGRKSLQSNNNIAIYQLGIFVLFCLIIGGSVLLKKWRRPTKLDEN